MSRLAVAGAVVSRSLARSKSRARARRRNGKCCSFSGCRAPRKMGHREIVWVNSRAPTPRTRAEPVRKAFNGGWAGYAGAPSHTLEGGLRQPPTAGSVPHGFLCAHGPIMEWLQREGCRQPLILPVTTHTRS